MSARILVTDDDAAIRTVVREALRRAGYSVETAAGLAEQRRALTRFRPDLLITDVLLPDGDGLEALVQLRAEQPGLPVIALSAQNTFLTAMRAAERGAVDYLPKPFDLEDLLRAVSQALASGTPAPPPLEGPLPLIGRSPAMQEVFRTVTRVLANDLTVLVLGESGTGKALVARAIHDFGARREGPFISVDLGDIAPDRVAGELFGEAGEAGRRSPGRFEQARGGTLFLDEVGDLPLDTQARLVRVLESGDSQLPGSAPASAPGSASVRIVAATHHDLPRRIAEGGFREDLYYRLNVVPLRLPPLRDRTGDVAELARHFLDRAALDGLPHKRLDAAAVARLERYGWPGNVRELENLMRRLAALGRDVVIDEAPVAHALDAAGSGAVAPAPSAEDATLADAFAQHLARYFARYGDALPPDGLYERMLAEFEKPLFGLALAAVRGNQLRAARLLGLNRNTLRKKLTERGVGPPIRGG